LGMTLTSDRRYSTLREEITNAMRERGVSPVSIAAQKNVSQSDLSRMLGGSRTFSLEVLDAVTEALELPPGYFYHLFSGECWGKGGKRLRKKTEEFVVRCYELGLTDLVEEAMNELTAIPGNLDIIFAIAESLFGKGHHDEALRFYNKVIEKESNRMSPDLAVSFYRSFLIVRDHDLITAYEAAVKLTEYLKHLKGLMQTEAYLRVLAVFYAIEHWSGVEKYAKELAGIAVGMDVESYAGALFYLGAVSEEKKDFKTALALIDEYSKGVSDLYSSLAAVNRMTVEISAGNTENIEALMAFIKQQPNRCRNLTTVIKSLVNFEKYEQIPAFLSDFDAEIRQLHSLNDPLSAKYIAYFRYYRSKYFFHVGMGGSAIEDLLYAIDLSARFKMPVVTIRCVTLLLKNITFATPAQIDRCTFAMEEYERARKYDTICIV